MGQMFLWADRKSFWTACKQKTQRFTPFTDRCPKGSEKENKIYDKTDSNGY